MILFTLEIQLFIAVSDSQQNIYYLCVFPCPNPRLHISQQKQVLLVVQFLIQAFSQKKKKIKVWACERTP